MSITRRKVENKISSKDKEIQELEEKLKAAHAERKGMKEILKILPRDKESAQSTMLRKGSIADKAYKIIKAHGKPMYVSKILGLIKGKKTTMPSLSSVLAQYARKNEIFTRPEPNTFGLLEWSDKQQESEEDDNNGGISRRLA